MKNNNTSYYSLSAYPTAADALNALHRFFSFDPHKNFIVLLRILCYYFHFTYKKTIAQSHDWALIAPRSWPLQLMILWVE